MATDKYLCYQIYIKTNIYLFIIIIIIVALSCILSTPKIMQHLKETKWLSVL